MKTLFDEEMTKIIEAALKRGNTIELKKERGNLVVVEIQRKMKTKASING